MAEVTTIKVTKALRDRIAGDAADEGVSAQAFIARLVDAHERNKRFKAVAAAYSGADDESLRSWRDETNELSVLDGDGLDT